MLADIMSRLITIDPNIQLDPELEGHEFGYFVFESSPNIDTAPKQRTRCKP